MVQCMFCERECANYCCAFCDRMTRGQKFGRLLQYLEKCAESEDYFDVLHSVVDRIKV
ncbi:unnamed protein product, partial [Adineta ricciae]